MKGEINLFEYYVVLISLLIIVMFLLWIVQLSNEGHWECQEWGTEEIMIMQLNKMKLKTMCFDRNLTEIDCKKFCLEIELCLTEKTCLKEVWTR